MMEVKTRKQAMLDGENKYFTGRPCRNGHMSFRYVQSGSCYDCINGSKISPDSPSVVAREKRLNEVAANLKAKQTVKENLALIRVRIFHGQREEVAAAAYALAAVRYPMLTLDDIDPKLAPTDKHEHGGAMYAFYCHDEDISMLRSIASNLFNANKRPLQVDGRTQAQRNIEEAGGFVDTTPPMSFK